MAEMNRECKAIFEEIRGSLADIQKKLATMHTDIRHIKKDIGLIAEGHLSPTEQKALKSTGGRVMNGLPRAAKPR